MRTRNNLKINIESRDKFFNPLVTLTTQLIQDRLQFILAQQVRKEFTRYMWRIRQLGGIGDGRKLLGRRLGSSKAYCISNGITPMFVDHRCNLQPLIDIKKGGRGGGGLQPTICQLQVQQQDTYR